MDIDREIFREKMPEIVYKNMLEVGMRWIDNGSEVILIFKEAPNRYLLMRLEMRMGRRGIKIMSQLCLKDATGELHCDKPVRERLEDLFYTLKNWAESGKWVEK